MIDWTGYTDEELDQAALEIGLERNRRVQIETIPNSMLTLNRDYLGYTGVAQEQAWRAPTGPHDSYPLDWLVRHVDKLWKSLVAFNDQEPGVADWEEIPPEQEWLTWGATTRGLDDVVYMEGDKVTHQGKNWRSVVNENRTEPGTGGASETFWIEVP